MRETWESLKNSGYVRDILPVAQPWVPLHPSSRVAQLGKVPSLIDNKGLGYGMRDWAQHETTAEEIDTWAANENYGICIQTRLIRAIDIDVPDPLISYAILEDIKELTGTPNLIYRYREGTGKILVPFIVEGRFRKHVVRFEHGIIEFLGNGQQFVAYGQHPDSGKPYLWDLGVWESLNTPLSIIFSLDEWRYLKLMERLTLKWGGFFHKMYDNNTTALTKASDEQRNDPVSGILYSRGDVIDGDGLKLYIRCPWEKDHTSEGVTSTTYMRNGHNSLQGSFKCLHAHCETRNTYDFLEEIGFTDTSVLPISDTVPMPEQERIEKRVEIETGIPLSTYAGKMRMTKEGEFKDDMATISNWLACPSCPVKIRYDDFTAEINIAHEGDQEFRPMKDHDIGRLRMDMQNRYNFASVNKSNAMDAVLNVARSQQYDSASEWLKSLQWDGVTRVKDFCRDYMSCADTHYSEIISNYMFTALAGRVLDAGCMVRIVPIFIGRQEDGKSSAIRALAPMKRMYASISMNSSDDDLARHLRGVLVAEWEEIRGMNVRDSGALKAYISKQSDKWVPKYKEFSDSYDRRFVMIGTNNPGKFLNDATGHSRFAPIKVLAPTRWRDIEAVRDKLWAEAAHMFNTEGILYQELSTYLKDNPRLYDEYAIVDAWENRVRKFLETNPRADDDEIFLNCLGKSIESCREWDVRRLETIRTRIATGL